MTTTEPADHRVIAEEAIAETAEETAAHAALVGELLASLDELLEQVDEVEARRTLRAQIARLERVVDAELATSTVAVHREHVASAPVVPHGPRVLDLGELERVRDALAARVEGVRHAEAAREREIADARARLEAMLAAPAAHRGVTVTGADLGESACVRWKAVPVLGVVGRLTGWWRVRMSSGCP